MSGAPLRVLALRLLQEHQFKNGCWFTNYSAIEGLELLASTTNGTSGIGIYRGRKVYWFQTKDEFQVEVTR